MSPLAILFLFLLVLIFYILPCLGLALLFIKAGEKPGKAFIPVYSMFIMLRISERPWYWILLQGIPVAGLFFTVAIWIEFLRTYGKTRFYQYCLVPLTFGLYLLYLGRNKKTRFIGPQEMKKFSRSDAWNGFAVGIVTIAFIAGLRTFVLELYTVPTSSMGKTMLVGDCFVVDKFSYGPRLPMTPLSIPYLPGVFPVSFMRAYSTSVRWDYHRPFSRLVNRGDVIVFNFPEGDTVINLPEYQSLRPYYEICREMGGGNTDSGRQIILSNPDQYPIAIRPVDKEENYVKRVVAIAGDTLVIRNQQVYIDGKPEAMPLNAETYYRVQTNGGPLDNDMMKEAYGVDMNDDDQFRSAGGPNQYIMLLTADARETMLKDRLATSIAPDNDSTPGQVWPYDTTHAWTRDNYGPVWIPQKGATLVLTPENYSLYERVIRTYEGNQLEMKSGKIYLNGQEASRYRFKMDYYWVMGDNLHGSQDSRYWGFVPEDHVVGKAGRIWFSWDKGIKWDRLFKSIE